MNRNSFKKAGDALKKVVSAEAAVKEILEGIRKLYFKYKLVGEIEISKGFLMTESIVVCEVDGTGIFEGEEPSEVSVGKNAALPSEIFNTMMFGVDTMVHDIIDRSKAYWKKSFKNGMSLAGTFTWSDPKGIFSWTVGCSVTMQSMHEYLFRLDEFVLTYGFTPDGKCLEP